MQDAARDDDPPDPVACRTSRLPAETVHPITVQAALRPILTGGLSPL